MSRAACGVYIGIVDAGREVDMPLCIGADDVQGLTKYIRVIVSNLFRYYTAAPAAPALSRGPLALTLSFPYPLTVVALGSGTSCLASDFALSAILISSMHVRTIP
jgi:hypothetical protein